MSKRPIPTPAGQFGLFETAPPAVVSTKPIAAPPTPADTALTSLTALSNELLHPYSRYGLAVAAEQGRLPDNVTEATLREALIEAIETGLGEFRMRTWSDPAHDEVLVFEAVKQTELMENPGLVQFLGLAARGIYLFPTPITTDGGASDTFGNALDMVRQLRAAVPLTAGAVLGRSFAPTTGKTNNGTASQSPPKGTLFEAACASIATVTPLKPAAWAKLRGSKEQDASPVNISPA